MSDLPHNLRPRGDEYRCPVCGYMSDICQCDESDFMAEYGDDWGDDEKTRCERCNGTGIMEELLGECPDCDGMGYKWWLP